MAAVVTLFCISLGNSEMSTSLKSICQAYEHPNKSLTLVIVGPESSSVQIVACDDVVSVVLGRDESDVLQIFDAKTLIWSSLSGIDIIDWESDPAIVLDDCESPLIVTEDVALSVGNRGDELTWFTVDTSL